MLMNDKLIVCLWQVRNKRAGGGRHFGLAHRNCCFCLCSSLTLSLKLLTWAPFGLTLLVAWTLSQPARPISISPPLWSLPWSPSPRQSWFSSFFDVPVHAVMTLIALALTTLCSHFVFVMVYFLREGIVCHSAKFLDHRLSNKCLSND